MDNLTSYDYHDAIIQIEMLFQSHILSFGFKEYSLETYVDKRFFSSWKGREGCEDTDAMRAGQNIDGILASSDPSEGEVLTYLQYTLNIAELCRRRFNKEEAQGYEFDVRNYTELLSRIRELLRRLHYDVKYVPEKEYIYLVPHNAALDAVTEDVSDPVSAAITEYRSSAVQGKLERKKQLLNERGDKIETYDDNHKGGNNAIYSRIKFLEDNCDIRKDNSAEGEEHVDRVAKMSEDELEKWYDEAYQLMLLRILTKENEDRIAEVDKLADECGTPITTITEEEIAKLLSAPNDPGALDDAENGKTNPDGGKSDENKEAVTEEERKEAEAEVRKAGSHAVRNVIIALVIADLLFIMFLLCYFFLL